MPTLDLLRRLWEHNVWADRQLWPAVVSVAGGAAWKEYLHVLGAEEVWLSRLERRTATVPVWPELTPGQAEELRASTDTGYRRYLEVVGSDALLVPVGYVNSAGQSFASTPADILTHVCLHGQYHRGKVNLMLRDGSRGPVPVDFIAFARGAPAAVTR